MSVQKPTRQKSGRVTIREVASDAGVSVAAVSKVLRDAYGVSDGLRAKVQASVKKLDYRPLASARGMRGQTYTLGVIFPDLRNPFFGDIFAGVETALERTQYQSMQGFSAHPGALIDAMIDRGMDGIILVGSNEELDALIKIAKRTPLVSIGQHDKAGDAFDTVNNNDRMGARLVVKHLAEHGYSNIAMLSHSVPVSSVIQEREHGYRNEMIEQGLGDEVEFLRAPQIVRDVQTLVRRVLQRDERPEALFCWTDFIAFEAIGVATELGLSIPDDIAIVGYDNTIFCDFAQNNLTSIDQSGSLLGSHACRLLIERINGRTEAEHFIVDPRIVARSSSKAIKK